mgnify:CR=1 FL=1
MEDWMKTIIAKERDNELLSNAYNNTYKVAVGEMTLDQLIDCGDKEIALMFNPHEALFEDEEDISKYISQTMIDDMIVYFIETEEYEKCAGLQKILAGSREPVKASKISTASRPPHE